MFIRRPQSAPRCPKCGYSLFGLPKLRCPECGHVIQGTDDSERARWLADDNAENRAAVRREWILAGLGVGLMLAGLAFTITAALADSRSSMLPTAGVYSWRWILVGAASTAGYLAYRRSIGEPMFRALFVLGLVWLTGGLLSLAIW
jgi:ribosomal protein L34E